MSDRQRPFEDSVARIIVLSEDPGDTARLMLSLAVRCDAELRRTVGRTPPRMPLYILPNSNRRFIQQGLCFYGVTDISDPTTLTHQLLHAVIWRFMLEIRQTHVSADAVPQWLIAALHHQLIERQSDQGSRNLFVASRIMAEANAIPPFATFFDNPIGPEMPVFYQLYCSSMGCILRVLRTADADILLRILRTATSAQPPSAQLIALLPQQLGIPKAQDWFRQGIHRQVFRIDQPNSYDQVKADLENIEQVTVMLPMKDGTYGVRRIRIDELPQYLERYDYSRYNITGMIADVVALMHNAPYVLRQSLAGYVEALDALRQGRIELFHRRIREARAEFAREYQYGVAVAALLQHVENTTMPASKRLFRYVHQTATDLAPIEIETRISTYLDELLEKKMKGDTASDDDTSDRLGATLPEEKNAE